VSQDGSHGNPPGYLRSRNQVGTTTTTISEISAELFNDAEYAGYVELGTSRMSAEPFLTPAMQYGARRLEEIMHEMFAGA
jgi:HK97 gp10 family phage protein